MGILGAVNANYCLLKDILAKLCDIELGGGGGGTGPNVTATVNWVCNDTTGVLDQALIVITDGVPAAPIYTPTTYPCGDASTFDYESRRECREGLIVYALYSLDTSIPDAVPTEIEVVVSGEECGKECQASECVTTQEYTFGLDNLGTYYLWTDAVYRLQVSDGAVFDFVQTTASNVGWTEQLNEWMDQIQAFADANGYNWELSQRFRYPQAPTDLSGGSGVPGPPSVQVSTGLSDMQQRYINFQICPGDPAPIGATIISHSAGDGAGGILGQSTENQFVGRELTTNGPVIGPVQTFYKCQCCGEEAVWYEADGVTPLDPGQIPNPNCVYPCGLLPSTSEVGTPACSFQTDYGCDTTNIVDPIGWISGILRVAYFCPGDTAPTVSYYQEDATGTLVPYVLAGQFVDCDGGGEVTIVFPPFYIDDTVSTDPLPCGGGDCAITSTFYDPDLNTDQFSVGVIDGVTIVKIGGDGTPGSWLNQMYGSCDLWFGRYGAYDAATGGNLLGAGYIMGSTGNVQPNGVYELGAPDLGTCSPAAVQAFLVGEGFSAAQAASLIANGHDGTDLWNIAGATHFNGLFSNTSTAPFGGCLKLGPGVLLPWQRVFDPCAYELLQQIADQCVPGPPVECYRFNSTPEDLFYREWSNVAPSEPIANWTTEFGRAIRLAFDPTATAPTLTGTSTMFLNDSDDSAGNVTVGIAEGWVCTPVPLTMRYTTSAEGYVAVLLGECGAPLTLQAELGKPNGDQFVEFEVPAGAHRIELWNIDTGGLNSSWSISQSALPNPGDADFTVGVGPLETFASEPVEEVISAYLCTNHNVLHDAKTGEELVGVSDTPKTCIKDCECVGLEEALAQQAAVLAPAIAAALGSTARQFEPMEQQSFQGLGPFTLGLPAGTMGKIKALTDSGTSVGRIRLDGQPVTATDFEFGGTVDFTDAYVDLSLISLGTGAAGGQVSIAYCIETP